MLSTYTHAADGRAKHSREERARCRFPIMHASQSHRSNRKRSCLNGQNHRRRRPKRDQFRTSSLPSTPSLHRQMNRFVRPVMLHHRGSFCYSFISNTPYFEKIFSFWAELSELNRSSVIPVMHGNGQSQPTRRQTTNHHQQRYQNERASARGRERDGRGWDAITNFLFALKTKAEHAEEKERRKRRSGERVSN